ncbi:phospholipase D-like domain-containing protein [Paenibacillus pinihumi]|uniref:phospholipase D-like domain-containing protein n=1 Tax=Paenibacillus pinihumi TaxID=669462 RepID=UPI0004183A1C|nr:phospholipase D-like domain-containing protein [Paenibacillus pinihumi]
MSLERIILVPGSIELVSSKDELNYQEVLDDFPNAEYIFVTTYNISAKRNYLLDLLKDSAEHAEVRIVTNIPNHYDTYYSDSAREKAKDSIKNYTKRLNSNEIDGIATFYHFDNHTKIVLTNNIAYIGSANFSDESMNNRETGTLIRDPEKVKLIIENLVPLIEDEGIQYFGDVFNKKQIILSKLLSDMMSITDSMKEGLFTYVGRFEENEVYNSRDPYVSPKKLNQLCEILYEFDEEINDLINVTGHDTFSESNIISNLETARNLCEEESPMYELAFFDHQDFACELISDELSYYDELDKATEIASQRAFDRHEELAEAAESDVNEFYNLIEFITDEIIRFVDELEKLHDQQQTIDNMKR